MIARSAFPLSLAAFALASLSGTAFAQATASTPAPENTVTANVGVFSEYIFRGISQTAGKPAVQGGFDWSHSSGLYAGTWASNVSWLEDFGVYSRSSLEWDFYGGFKQNFPNSDFWYDLGTVYYYYPGSKNPGVVSADTWELYAGVLKGVEFGAYYSGNNAENAFYTDLTGYDTAKDRGVVYVKKTF